MLGVLVGKVGEDNSKVLELEPPTDISSPLSVGFVIMLVVSVSESTPDDHSHRAESLSPNK